MLVSSEAAGLADPNPATSTEKEPAVCVKKCGSNNCRHELLKKRCPGWDQRECISSEPAPESTRAEAVACMTGVPDREWLIRPRNGYEK